MNMEQWAQKWNIPAAAMAEMRAGMGMIEAEIEVPQNKKLEAYTQSLVRLEAPEKGVKLWRNNVGVLMDINGRPVRFGLLNDSKAVNEVTKSSDLIGFRPLRIRPDMVGTLVAQFVARECKKPDWHYVGDAREQAQVRFLNLVASNGGDAAFTTGAGSL